MRHLWIVLFFGILVCVSGCSKAAVSAGGNPSNGSVSSEIGGLASSYSPSLGTEWGERIESKIEYVRFERAEMGRPNAVATIHYDDAGGMKSLVGRRADRSRPFTILQGDIEFGLTDEEHSWTSSYLSGVERNGKYFVRGESGDRYGIYLKNRSDRRVEFVVSVDGVDVINGQQANFDHRGYIIGPGDSFKVEGFRDSRDSVAAFRFSDARHSYVAEKTGDTRNVGVIGIAVFEEKEEQRFSSKPARRDWKRRSERVANPFPGEFASAP